MDDVLDFCRRVLGAGPLADQAAAQAEDAGRRSPITRLAAAAEACRALSEKVAGDQPFADTATGSEAPRTLAATVAREVALATGQLPELQREVLALREHLGLSHGEIARAMQIKPSEVAPLLAHARLGLRAARRGPYPETRPACDERERALGLLARRQDGETVSDGNREWLLAHMADCKDCEIAHAAMLEASVCYRAWQ